MTQTGRLNVDSKDSLCIATLAHLLLRLGTLTSPETPSVVDSESECVFVSSVLTEKVWWT